MDDERHGLEERTAGAPRFPSELTYRGQAFGSDGAPLAGRFALDLRYLNGERELLRERQVEVEIAGGRFTVELGKGAMKAGGAPDAVSSLRALFAANPEVELEVTIAGVPQAPRIRILPAGHSLESTLVLAGKATPNDGKPHVEGYRSPGGASAVQAVLLRPAPAGSAGTGSGGSARPAPDAHGPFELEVRGPWRSKPLREIPAREAHARSDAKEAEDKNEIRHESLFDERGVRFGTGTAKIVDALADPSASRSAVRTPSLAVDFAGIPNIDGYLPPDTIGAVGPDHYVQVVNTSFQVFFKNGTSAGGPYPTSSLWSGFGGNCEALNDGDAVFMYDRYASRWLFAQFAVSGSPDGVCLAVSESSDPLGSYYLYDLVTQHYPDYFKLGVWPDPQNNAYFLTTNTGVKNGYDVYALDRERMLEGLTARPAIFFLSYPNLLMPADANGPRLPPPGSNGLLYTFRDGGESYFGTPPADSLDLYQFHVDWATPASSTLTLAQSFTSASGGFADFNWTVCGFFTSNCLPQPDTAQGLDSASWWPMHRMQYRRFADHEALVGSWTVNVTGTPDHAAPRWFELRRAGGPWSIFQQGTHAPDAANRWMPSIAMDGDGNIGLGYSAMNADTNLFASIRYATHAAGDAPGSLQAEQTLVTGTGAQTHSAARWGDYASMTIDPVDDCTFWYTSEYVATTGSAPWLTRIGAFRYPGCGGLVVTPTVLEACGEKGSAFFDVALSEKFDATTNLAVTGCPAGATCAFSVNPVVAPDTSSQLEISDLGAAASGIYPLGIEATEEGNPSDSFATTVALEIWAATPGEVSLLTPANAASSQAQKPALSWSPLADASAYEIQIATDPLFQSIVYARTVNGASHDVRDTLASSSLYFWRVRGVSPCGDGDWSAIRWFTTLALATDCPVGKMPNTLHSYDFESGASGWTSSGTGDSWAQSATRAHSGAASWHADNPAEPSDQRLVSPSLAIPAGAGPVSLRFWNYQSIEHHASTSCYDGGILEVSTNGGGSFNQVTTGLVSDPYNGPIAPNFSNPLKNLNAWCGDPQDWLLSIVDLSSYAGQNVLLRFRLGTDNAVGREGWYLDDVALRSCVVDPVIFVDGLETSNTTRWTVTSQ